MPPKILVVDDDPGMLALLTRYVKEGGYQAIPALRPEEALLHARRELPDAAVIDLVLPKTDGFALHRDIRAIPKLEDLNAVFVSGMELAASMAESAAYHQFHVLRKSGLMKEDILGDVRIALLARRQRGLHDEKLVRVPPGMVYILLEEHFALYDGGRYKLSDTLLKVLRVLIAHPNGVSNAYLGRRVWLREAEANKVRVTVKRLKKALGPAGADLILKTEGGYRLSSEPLPAPGGVFLLRRGLAD